MLLTYPEELPISGCRDRITEAIRANQVVVIAGDTGSGKTTQLPKMCLQAGRGSQGMIGCTQPRRIAAISVSERVAEEIRDPAAVGYKIRFRDQTAETTRIKFMTDGILLAETRHDRLLGAYDTLIVDEAHERSLNIDFLLGYLKGLLAHRPELKLIISSATIDTEKFSRHFGDTPIIEVSGRTYPVDIHYEDSTSPDDDPYVDRAVERVLALATAPDRGDILVFMPTERDIIDTVDSLAHRLQNQALVLPLFGRLQAADQRRIFRPAAQRKIIVATNIAETSITVPGIRYVVDTGLARLSRYNVRARTTSLLVARISQASCEQRAGRCGRTGPGICFRLYSEEDFLSRPEFTLPEIQRSNLAEVILQMIALGLGDPRDFPFIDPPTGTAIRDGFRILHELGALTAEERLTGRGRIMARLPLDPCISRIIIEADSLGALREIKVIAAALSIQDPRIRPADKEEKADTAHRRFTDHRSDFLTFLNIWDTFHATREKVRSAARLRKFCTTHYLSWQRMREWLDVHDQINRQLRQEKRFHDNSRPASYDAIHQALTSGFLRNIGQRKEKNIYQVAGGREIMLFPGSSLFGQGGRWIVAADFIETSRLFARTAAVIDERWLEKLGGELCRRSWSEPHWSKKAGQVVALERVTLFGLTIVAGRRVNYGRIRGKKSYRQEARQIFIRSALVQGELGGRYPFLDHNLGLARRYREMEERLRRRDILVDDEAVIAFYAQRLPDSVYDRFTLNRLLKKKKKDTFLRMTEEDLCLSRPAEDELYRFPPVLQVGDLSLSLHYLFEPGNEADGVTVEIPSDLAADLPGAVFEWLVPGMLPEKVLLLLKRLPKKLRRRLVPLPDAVDRILDGLDLYRGSLYPALERVLLRQYQLQVQRGDWRTEALPLHLKMRFRLVNEKGRTLFSTRSFPDLLRRQQKNTVRPVRSSGTAKLPEKHGITDWAFDGLRETVQWIDPETGQPGLCYPALFAENDDSSLCLRYIGNRQQAIQANRAGLRLLYGLQFGKEYRMLFRECKAAVAGHSASWLSLGARATAGQLKDALAGCIMARLFNTWQGQIPDRQTWEQQVEQIRQQGLLRLAGRELDLILDLLASRREVRVRITQWAQRAKKSRCFQQERLDEYVATLEEIVPPDFLSETNPTGLEHKKRYLQALARRIERAEQAPAKDTNKARQLGPALARLRQLKALERSGSVQCQEGAARYRFMVDEFRVSIFAPELGTAIPVSEKRLKKQWQEVEDLCRSVEK